LNYVTTGLSYGIRRRKVLKSGLELISILYGLLPMMIHNLQTMPWVLPLLKPDGDKFHSKLLARLGLDPDLYDKGLRYDFTRIIRVKSYRNHMINEQGVYNETL
jgi:hypothetical protein